MNKKISIVIPLAPGRKIESENMLERFGKDLKIYVEEGKNPSVNRNNGIKKTKTELVAFINAHSKLSDDWAFQVKNFFEENIEIDVVGGPQITELKGAIFERATDYALNSTFGAGGVINRYKPGKIKLDADEQDLTSANLICKKKVFKKVLFDENLWPGEDPKFISDCKKAGFKVAYSPDIIVYNKRRKNTTDFARQIFNYGLSRAKKENLFETFKKPYFLVPVFFTFYLGIFLFLTLIHSFFILPLILYFILMVYFSFFASIKNNDLIVFFPMILIFLTIHVAYGLGFIYGNLIKSKRENERT